MKICFLWINKFRNFENLSVNLSSDIKFKFNHNSRNLTIAKKFPALSGFFGNQIVDVTGVIGKNGSGKSNVLEMICKILKESKSAIRTDFLLVEENDGLYTCHHSFADGDSPTIPRHVVSVPYSGAVEDLKVIFFSNVYDGRQNNFGSEIRDISVNAQNRRNSLSVRTGDFLKQYTLVSSNVFDELNIDYPERIVIRNKLWNVPESYRLDPDSRELIYFIKKTMRGRIRELAPQKKFVQILRIGIFFDIYNSLPVEVLELRTKGKSLPRKIKDYLDEAIKKSAPTETITRYLIDSLEPYLNDVINNKHATSKYSKGIRKQKNLFELFYFSKNLDDYLSSLKYEYDVEGSRLTEVEYFAFDYGDPNFREFSSVFIGMLDFSRYFEMDWIGLSSGHKAYLNLFSSIFDELRRNRHKNILLCIDEGDLYLHPKWQVEFLSRLVYAIPKMCTGNVQLVLTSHSPFLVSDLPNHALVVLDKDRPLSQTDGTLLGINTFGGNLYRLYSTPFFLQEKRISDFAYSKISEWIAMIENSDLTKKQAKYLEEFLDLIGDDVIRSKLKKELSQ